MNHYVIIFRTFFLGIILLLGATHVKAQYDFGFSLDSEVGNSVNEGILPAESQTFITVEQNWMSSDRKTKAILQVRMLQASQQIERNRYDVSEVYPVDTYVEFQSGAQRLTIGYQHIFLIEGFDTVGMELINPKNDNTSFFLDADKKFYTVPALNYKWISDIFTFQALAVLQHRSDEQLQFVQQQIKSMAFGLEMKDLTPEDRLRKNDFAIRVLKSFQSIDFSFSLLKTFEKSAQYTVDLPTLSLQQQAEPFTSLALSLAGDLNGFVTRFDYLVDQDRKTVLSNLDYVALDYQNLNFGIEHDFIFSSSLSLNYSQSKISTDLTPVFRKKNIEDIYLRWTKKFAGDLDTEVLFLQRLSDKGTALNLKIAYPLSPLINVKAGLETFGGDSESQFRAIKDLSRVYVGLYSTIF